MPCGNNGASFTGRLPDNNVGLGLTNANAITAAIVSYGAASGSANHANVGGRIDVTTGTVDSS